MDKNLPTKIENYQRHDGGIAETTKNAPPIQYGFGRSINYRTNPYEITLLPKTTKESGSVVTALPRDGDIVDTDLYYYDEAGSIYKRTSAGSHSLLRTVAGSSGNGMKYYGEDDFLYYTSDTVIGRYGQIGGTPSFVDDFLGSEGGVPLNTYWIDFEASSSMYATRADTASTSITGDLAMEMTIKPESLPTAGNSMVLMSKWDVNGNIRSYKFEIYAASGYFGDGTDGALTISSNTTEAPIDSACTGTTGTTSLSATNVSFAAGQVILIHQTKGTGAGTYQKNKIASYTAGTITLDTALNATYVSGAQVRVLKQYTDVTINSGITYTAKAWNGTVGGIIAFLASGTVTVTGTITASSKGFSGGARTTATDTTGLQGDSSTGSGSRSTSANGAGGGGGQGHNGSTNDTAGAGGGHGAAGSGSTFAGGSAPGTQSTGGSTDGNADLTDLNLGAGGGAGGSKTTYGGAGGTGGGIVFIAGTTFTISGAITSAGSAGEAGSGTGDLDGEPGGGGAGGAILIKAQTATLGTTLITAAAGGKGTPANHSTAGDGAVGRIHLDYYTSYTGTTTPTLDVAQDNTLLTNTTYQLRLGLSPDGTAEEFLTKAASIAAAQTNHVGVSWDASASTATFFLDGVSLGTSVGAVTSLNNNASRFAIACDFNNAARNFYDGKMDEARLWNTERTEAQMLANKSVEIAVNSAGLAAYYQLDNAVTDSTSNANDLTATNSPTYSTDVPFSSPTTRLDLDQFLDTSGDTYALTTAIAETAAHRQTFVPAKDPQKSIEVNITDTGDDSDWTLTVHDSLNRVVASKTITHANLHTGDMEFVFDDEWRPIIGASYHFHLTATTTTGTPLVLTTTSNDLETADFHTYYQFLVDTVDHPILDMLNFIMIGNDRYAAKYSASGGYEPHKLTFPSGYHVRCMAKWREYIVFGCWKNADSLLNADRGHLFFWNGYSTTYDFDVEIPEGGVNAMYATKGILYVHAGYHGDVLAYLGGDATQDDLKRRIPKINDSEYMEILPHAVNMWDGLLRWGIGGVSDSSDVERGIYTYGKRKSISPVSLSFDYPISTGTRGSNVKIGLVIPVQKKLLIGWKDGTAYGMDVVDPTGDCFTTGTIEKDIKDNGNMWKEKQVVVVRADFLPLTTGQTMKVKYRLDRATNWTEGATDNETGLADDVGDTFARLTVPIGNHRELEVAVDIGSTSGVSPTLLEFGDENDYKGTEHAY